MIPLLVEIYDPDEDISVEMAFTESPVRIGRNPLNDVVLTPSYVSSWHAVCNFDDRSTSYVDLGSTNGTIFRGKRVGRQPLVATSSGELEVMIGATRVKFIRQESQSLLMYAQDALQKLGADGASLFLPPPSRERSSDNTTSFDVGAARSLVDRVGLAFTGYRRGWLEVFETIQEGLAGLPEPMQIMALDRMLAKYPELGHEPEFEEFARELHYRIPGPAGVRAAASHAIDRFVSTHIPHVRPPKSAGDIELFFNRLSLLVQTFSRSFVEQRDGQREFGAEMAVRTVAEGTKLADAGSVSEVLDYLLDWTIRSERPVKELVNAYADIMIHNVALINGLMEGARSLLRRVGPDVIARDFFRKRKPSGLRRALMWLKLTRCAALWQHYVELHGDLLEEEVALTTALFGNDFARAYAAIGDEGRPSGLGPGKGHQGGER